VLRSLSQESRRHLAGGSLLAAVIVVLAAWAQAAVAPDGPWAPVLDLFHWTVSGTLGTWLAILGATTPGLPAQQRTVRGRLAMGIGCSAVGQWVWDLYYARGILHFPSLPDVLYLCSPLVTCYAIYGIAAPGLAGARRTALLLDTTSFALAVAAISLTIYLPQVPQLVVRATPEVVAFNVAFPVFYLSVSAFAVVLQLHMRQRWNWRWIALVAALWAGGLLYMLYILGGGQQASKNGSLVHLAISLIAIAHGWGAAGWRPQPDTSASYDRLCEGVLRQLPLALVAMASATIGLLMIAELDDALRMPLLGMAAGVLVFAVLRQTQQLAERDRLLEAERTVASTQAQLQHLAHHDPLTGLPNLTLLRDRVQQAMSSSDRRGTRTALLFIDLDHFKEVNDTLGHSSGDALLRHVARLLGDSIRSSDTVSRQGGDEFSVVLPDIDDLSFISVVAEKVMGVSASSVQIAGHELPLSMSVGIAIYPDDARDFETLLRCADTAMYRAKAAGRNTFRFYDAVMHAESAERIRLRTHLAHAIERGELSLHYQPLVEIDTRRICGAEALLRWNHPELGSVSPVAFIPVAESSGLIVEIGRWVLLAAARQAAEWTRRGLPPVPVSVNVSVLQFRRGDLESQVSEALRSTGIAPDMLELEVTESILMQDQDRVLGTVRRLTELGVGIAIDDFGTGYSSLSYVRRMHLSRLKIDRSFVHDALSDRGAAAIVRATIDMAHTLDIDTVAEGVETEAQLAFLRSYRCGVGQGYLFGRPMPPDDFERFVREHEAGVTRRPRRAAVG
jgi:diguanylate cyclase (GGDEF)-like protein